MLSKTTLFVLAIIAGNPINPYAICKVANYKRKNFRSPIHTQTIYSIVNSLHKKRLISGKRTKNGKRPDTTVYSITSKGNDLLKKDLLLYLSHPEDPLSELSLSAFIIGQLDKEAVLAALKEYQKKSEKEIAARKKQISEESEREVSCFSLIAIEHTLNILKINLDTVTKLINKIEINAQWDYSPIPFWRDEVFQNKKDLDSTTTTKKIAAKIS